MRKVASEIGNLVHTAVDCIVIIFQYAEYSESTDDANELK
jgi:hypothetical protein